MIARMQAAYPDLDDARQLILKVADNEETAFRRTLGAAQAFFKSRSLSSSPVARSQARPPSCSTTPTVSRSI